MSPDDASFAEMPRPPTDPDADPLALDEETVERLLAGDLPPSEVPPGYAQVAALLAATAAEPTPEELAGQAEVLAELRAVTWKPRRAAAHTRRAARPPRRRWAGLAAAALVGALVTGGVAAAATGNLPGPVQNVARSILDTVGGVGPGTPTMPAPASTSRASTPGSVQAGQSTRPTGATGPGPATTGAAAAPNPNLEGLCQAYLASEGAEQGKKLEATAFQDLAKLAGGRDKIDSYCEKLVPGRAEPKEKKKEPPPPSDPGQGQGQGEPPVTTGAGGQGQSAPDTPRPGR